MNETLPGLWEFPMWDVQNDEGVVLTNMDPQVGRSTVPHPRSTDQARVLGGEQPARLRFRKVLVDGCPACGLSVDG